MENGKQMNKNYLHRLTKSGKAQQTLLKTKHTNTMTEKNIKVNKSHPYVENTLPLLFDTHDNVGFYKCLFSFSKTRQSTPSITITLSYTTFGREHTVLGELKLKRQFHIDYIQATQDYTDTFYSAIQQEDAAFRKLFKSHGLINYPADQIPAITMEMLTNAIMDLGRNEPIW